MARKKDNTLLTVLAVGVAVYALTRNTTPTPPPMPPPVQPPPGGAFFGYANQAVDLLGNILSTFGGNKSSGGGAGYNPSGPIGPSGMQYDMVV